MAAKVSRNVARVDQFSDPLLHAMRLFIPLLTTEPHGTYHNLVQPCQNISRPSALMFCFLFFIICWGFWALILSAFAALRGTPRSFPIMEDEKGWGPCILCKVRVDSSG